MGEFNVNFLGKATDASPTPERYRDYFLAYEPERWSGGAGDGSFVFFDDLGGQFSLLVSHEVGLGISLMHDVMRPGSPGTEAASVGDAACMNEFFWTGNELWLPRGSFLKPEHAWLGVEDFIISPTVRSTRVAWQNTNELDWPEM